MLKRRNRKARKSLLEIPSDAQFGLRGIFVLMTVIAVMLSAIGPTVRTTAGDSARPIVAAWGILIAQFAAIAVFQGLLRRRAEKQCGPPRHTLLPPSYVSDMSSKRAALIAGTCRCATTLLVVGFVASGAAQMFVVATTLASIVLLLLMLGASKTMCVPMLWWRGKVRLNEHGIVTGSQYIEWKHCYRYEWSADRPNVLVTSWSVSRIRECLVDFQYGLRGFRPTTIELDVPKAEREAVKKMVELRVWRRQV